MISNAALCMSGIMLLEHNLIDFPDPVHALDHPNGLLAVGGDLGPERLIRAYQSGIFPWYEKDQPILWWSPDPRSVLLPDWLHISHSLKKTLKQGQFCVTYDQNFHQVIQACSDPRTYSSNTWITDQMLSAYQELHRLGYAHSVEVWQDNELAGGLYGIAIGRVFFGESMFSLRANASKVGFCHLVGKLSSLGFHLIDCQIHSPHLASLGAKEIPRTEFLRFLNRHIDNPLQSNWE